MDLSVNELISIAILVAGWIVGGALYVWWRHRNAN